jgi:SP family facilitated glucose transporter-like MFS transporter 1
MANSDSGLNLRLAFAIAAGAIGSGFQHGYNTGVLNAPQALITAWLRGCPEPVEPKAMPVEAEAGASANITDVLEADCMSEGQATLIWAWIVAVFCIGGMIGGSCVGLIASGLGRKTGLLLNNILAAIGALLMLGAKYANSYEMLIAGRLVIGINSGINAGISPMYLTEICPTSLRGAVGTVYQLIITISILISQVLGMGSVLGNEAGWPILLGLTIVPGILQLLTLPFCPESPKFLLLDRDNEELSRNALTWLRGRDDVHEEMDEMRAEQESMKLVPKVTLKEMLFNSTLRQPLIIAMMMMMAQQLSGINCAMFYSTSIFLSAGLTSAEAQQATLGMGVVNVGMTFVSLVLVERAGRKTLMIIGLCVMFVSTCMILVCLVAAASVPALAYLSIAMVILFVVGFATGPGSIPWFFVTELFNQSGRPMATSIAVVTNWSANFLVGLGFSPLQLVLGPYVFIIFIVAQVLFVVYVWFQVPETKNKTIEEITAQFRQNN